ncbi:MAG TPA: hypothetical protein DGH68_04370 [Bacteroidetes bacterium]|jgi:hypothetical protein|nr:hypothetical protein [Bacteroidota bacterium]
MMKKVIVNITLCIALMQMALSEELIPSLMMKRQEVPSRVTTGNLRVDLFGQTGLAEVPFVALPEEPLGHPHKSPYLAAGLSLVVPGTGEIYTERYWEAAAFFVADVAAWLLAYNYDKKGDQQTSSFQTYADARWDVVKYGEFSMVNYVPASERGNYNWLIPGTEGRAPWLRVNWDELNRMERYIGSAGGEGQYYSHTLPPYGDQQYYELIGKYQEFYQGWDDADPTLTTYVQITQRLHSSPQPNMIYYSKERGKANDYYASATTWVTVAVINHVASAAYAALSAGWYNSAHAELGLQQVPTETGYTSVPVMKMRWEF